MKKTGFFRYAALILCLLFCLMAVVACNSGSSGNETTDSQGESTEEQTTEAPSQLVKFVVSEYNLIRPESTDSATVKAAAALNKYIQEKCNASFKSFSSDFLRKGEEPDPNALEILIGATNRSESMTALESIEGYGYCIKIDGNKIVITATTGSLMEEAVNYFIENYLAPNVGEGYFSVPENMEYMKNGFSGVTFISKENTFDYKVLYSEGLDATTSPKQEGSSMNDYYDYVVQEAVYFRQDLAAAFGNIRVDMETDYLKRGQDPDPNACEILIGRTNRPESDEFLRTLKANEYGFAVIGNKLVITGWSDLTVNLAMDLFISKISSYTYIDPYGHKNLTMMDGTSFVEAYAQWDIDIPTYDGGVMTGVMEGLDSCYEIYMTETNTTEYAAYRAKLEAAGYKLHQENQIASNLFATYYNDKTMIHAYYVDYSKSVRIVTEPMSKCVLPQNEDPFVKVTDTTFTMVDLDNEAGNFGNCFIIVLEDGSFIVHDGGGSSGKDLTTLYKALKALNIREDGKIHIAAWMLSHAHWDHFKNFYDFVNKYQKEIVLENIVYNQAVTSIIYNSGNPDGYINTGKMADLQRITKCKIVKVHTGQTMQIRNLKIEFIYTQEDLYPTLPYHFNNTSLVSRFDVGGQRVTITGDIEDIGSQRMVDMYGKELKTDILQVAHHGWGGTSRFYEALRPTILLWPTDEASFKKQTAGTSSSYYYAIDYALYKQPNVKMVVVADKGHKTIKLPSGINSATDIIVWTTD